MNYLSQFRAANPDLQGFSDDQIVEALPQLLPERFGGKPMSQVRAEALLAPEELEIRQYEQQGGGIGSSIERGLLRVNQTFNAAGAALGDAVMGAMPDSVRQSDIGQWLQGQADQDKLDIVRDQERMGELPQRPEMLRAIEAANNAETGMGAIGAFAKEVWNSPDTAGFLVDTMAEQIPVMATMALGTKGAGGLFGTSSALGRAATFGTGAGIGSGSTTFGSNVAEAMGQDISKFDEASDYAFKRSLAQAIVDGTVGAVVPFKIGGNQIVNIPTQAVLQAAGGAAGEYAGGAAVGEELSKGELVAEGLLELLSLPADLAMANIEYFNSKRNPVADANTRINAAGDQVAAAGGDALAQESAKAQAASSEIPGAVGEAKTIADTIKAAGQVSAADLGLQMPEQRDWSQYDSAPIGRETAQPVPRQVEQAAPRQSARDMSGLDGLIITADRMGFADEAAMLRTSQRLYRQADEARAKGDNEAASRFVDRGNRLYREATETNDQVREIADQYPVPYVATGEVTGGEVGPYQGPGRTGATYDQPRSVGGPASLEQQRTNRLNDSGIIFGEEPDYARAQRQQMESERAQRTADDFSARYGQEGQTPFRPTTIDGELDRSSELPPAQRQAALPPGTGQINMGQDRPQQGIQQPQTGYEGIGRNTVERTAQAKTDALPAGNATRAITPEQYRNVMERARLALRTPVSRRTPEMTQALEVRNQVRAGEVAVSENAQPDTPRIAGEQIDQEWTRFTPESGTLNVPRAEMPQVKAENRGALVNYLNARGIDHQQAEIDPRTLKPTQAEFSPAKVQKAREFTGGDRSILVSADGHVVDGHHQWMAKRDTGKPVKVIQLQAPIDDLVPLIREFPSSEQDAGAQSNNDQANTDQPELRLKANGTPFASERAAQASAAFRDNRDYASVVPVDGGFAVQIDTQARDQAETQATEATQAKSDQAKRRMFREPDTVNDDMLDAIALMGGIDRAEAEAEGIDPTNFGRQAGGIRYVFPRQNGDSFDGMAERLAQYGYLDPRIDRLDDLRAKLDQAINGNAKIMTPEGYEALAEKEAAAEAQLQQEHEPLADDITSDEAWAGEAYANALEQGVPAPVIDAILEQYSDDPVIALVELNDAINQSREASGTQAGESQESGSDNLEATLTASRPFTPEQAAEIFGEPEQAEPLLTSYTEQDLQAQDDARTAAEEAEARTQREAEQKAQADAEVNDFSLTGSNRPADIAAAAGQNDMFGLGSRAQTEPSSPRQSAEPTSQQTADTTIIEDVGEKLGRARKDELRTARERLDSLDDQQIAASTMSKLWPKDEINKIEDPVSAALYHVARSEVPNKPRATYKLKRWVEYVKWARDVLRMIDEIGASRLIEKIQRGDASVKLKTVADKVELLTGIDRSLWDRIGRVEKASGTYRDGDEMVSGSWILVEIDKRMTIHRGTSEISEVLPAVKAHLEKNVNDQPAMKFEIRHDRRHTVYQINKAGDNEQRPLKTFDTLKEARDYLRNNNADLVAAWEAVKQRDNVTKADMRSDKNRERTGQDYRGGKDVSAEEFIDTFGFRGAEFGNWVKQGKAGQERQGLLNDAYDAFMDLANVLGLPPKALSFEGRLGIGFGSRGRGGRNAAHYEPDLTVINLTKTKGAGSLAHEWFHALDNYFSRKRGDTEFNGDQKAYREGAFVTYRPEPMMAYKPSMKNGRNPYLITNAEYNRRKERGMGFNESDWTPDPSHPQGIRPEVEKVFAELVETLDASPMLTRAQVIDKGKVDGYWSQIIERAARSFETHIIAKLAQKGYRNDFLANVTSFEKFKRDPGRYPYLKPDEQGPVSEAFDKLFSTIETKETESGVAMFSRTENAGLTISRDQVEAAATRITSNWTNAPEMVTVATDRDLPADLQDTIDKQNARGKIDGVFHKGRFYLVADKIRTEADVERIVLHEALGHYGLRQLYGPAFGMHMDRLFNRVGGYPGIQRLGKKYGFDLSSYWENAGDMSLSERREMMADELIAHIAGTGTVQPDLIQKIAHLIRKGLRKIMAGTRFAERLDQMTDVEVLSIVAAARKAVVEGESQITVLTHDPRFVRDFEKVVYGDARFSRVPDDASGIEADGTESLADRTPYGSIRNSVNDRVDGLRFQIQDKLIDLKRKQQEAGEVEDDVNAYQKAAIWEGRAGERLSDFDEERVQPLLDQVAQSGLSLEEVGEWLVARHAEEANAYLAEINPDKPDNERFRLAGMSNEEAQAILEKHADNKALQEVGKQVDQINQERVSMLVDEGLITQETADAWQSRYKNYVPLNREEADTADRLPSRGKGFQIKGKESKMRTGSAYWKPDKILSHVIANYESSIVRAEKNKVGEALLKFAEANPDENFWAVDTERTTRTVRNGKVVEGAKLWDAPNELTIKRDGVEHVLVFNPNNKRAMRLVSGLKNLQAAEMNTAMQAMAKVTRFLAMINTSFNPEFMISNFVRDIQTAGYNLSDTELKSMELKVIKDVFPAMGGIRNALFGDGSKEWASVWEDFRKNGGKTGWIDIHSDMKAKEKNLVNIVERIRKGKAPKHMFRRFLNGIEDMNNVIENGVRLSAYKHALDAGLSKERAAALAKDLTVNFNRKGAMGPQLNAFYMFFNAAVQGNVRLLQAMVNSKKGRTLAIGTIGFAVMLDMINRSIAGDDDDGENAYDALPDYVKDRNIIVMMPGGTEPLIKLPAPWGYNTLHVAGQEIGKAISGERFNPLDSAGRVAMAFADAFNPVGSGSIAQMIAPTIVDPIVQVAENKNFAGNPLMPEHTFDAFQPRPEYQMHFSTVREGSKAVAEWLNDISGGNEIRPGAINISPEVIDLLVDTSTGGLGRMLNDSIDFTTRLVTGEEIEVENVPFLRKVTGFNTDYGVKGRYYEWSTSVGYAKDEAKKLKGRELMEARRRPEFKLIGLYTQTDKQLRALRKRRKAAEKMGASDAVIERIDEQIRQVMARFNKRYVEVVLK